VKQFAKPVFRSFRAPEDVGNLSDLDLLAIAPKIGFPLLIKATSGGGGKGMREVNPGRDARIVDFSQT